MEENNNKSNATPSELNSKNEKKQKKEKKKMGNFFSEIRLEFKKITWPTRKILFKQTITVIFISIIVGAIIFGYDLGIDFLIEKLIYIA